MISENSESEFDSYSKNYDSTVNASISFTGLKVDFFTKVKADCIVEVIGSHFNDGEDVSVLDVGCGIGNYHPFLSGKVGSIAGVDISSECIATARENNKDVAYQVYDGARLPYEDASFDVAYTICVMHHVPPLQWPAFASELRRVVKPGGLALVFEHNPFNPLTRRAVSNCEFDADAVLLRAAEVAKLLENAGFGSRSSHYILAVPPLNRLLSAIDKLFSKVPLGGQYYVKAS